MVGGSVTRWRFTQRCQYDSLVEGTIIMKKDLSYKLTLLGATALALTACSEAKEEALTYNTVESCISAKVVEEATCRAEFKKAEQDHTKIAPRYNNANQCYSDFGYDRCRRSSSGFWLPFMVGYMIAPRRSSLVYTQPLYRTSSYPNSYTTATNTRIGSVSRDGRTSVAKSRVTRPPVRTRTVARSGFGRRTTSSGG